MKRWIVVLLIISILAVVIGIASSFFLVDPVSRSEFGNGKGEISSSMKAPLPGYIYVSFGASEPLSFDYDDDYDYGPSYTLECEVCDEDGNPTEERGSSLIGYETCFRIDEGGSYNIRVCSGDCPYSLWARALYVSDISYGTCCCGCCVGPLLLFTSIALLIGMGVSAGRKKRKVQKRMKESERRIFHGMEPSPQQSRDWKEKLEETEDLGKADDYYYEKWGRSFRYER
ncbi:MAG: hypothetical protein ACMUHY_05405 [Thermoplasmatota archaeon]